MTLKEGKTVIKDVKREQELTLIHRINNSHACMTPRALITATKYKLVILVGIVLLCRPTKPWPKTFHIYTHRRIICQDELKQIFPEWLNIANC
jgi:hypothetical protein